MSLDFSGNRVCIGGESHIYFWRKDHKSREFKIVEVFENAHSLEINSVDWSFSPEEILVSVSDDRFCYIWKDSTD
jgi:hypothetical protein